MTKTPNIGPFRVSKCCILKELYKDTKETVDQLLNRVSEFADHVKKSRKYADDMEKLIRRERSTEECDSCTYFYIGAILGIAGIFLSSYLIYTKYYDKNQQITEITDSEQEPLNSNNIQLETVKEQIYIT